MTDPMWAALAVVVAALIAGTPGLVLWSRQREALEASAERDEAETAEITDRIAREWIATLEARVNTLSARLDEECRLRREERAVSLQEKRDLLAHIGDLESHINDRKPPPPPARPAIAT